MITDKIDMLKLKSVQYEMLAIKDEFRAALDVHFTVVNANATRLINARWCN